ncbi:MAG: peptidylprolyl isomerase [Caulobacterales bacterium]
MSERLFMTGSKLVTRPKALRDEQKQTAQPMAARFVSLVGSLKPWLREPIVHFFLLGAFIFLLSEVVEHFNSRYRIVVGPDQITRLAATFEQNYGNPPSDQQLAVLVDNYIKEEILYRESVALGLDKGDEIVRRRLVQKFEFLQQDLNSVKAPSDEDLRNYFAANPVKYAAPERRSLTQIYFSPDLQGDAEAKLRAEETLKALKESVTLRAPQRGDIFPGPSDVADLDQDSAQRLFGKSELTQALYTAPPGVWSGPYRSGFGWHLVRVTEIKPKRQLTFAEVADKVREDYLTARGAELNAEAMQSFRAKYQIVQPGPAE